MSSMGALRLGTRASPLARWQAEWVAARLAEFKIEVALLPISTRGDRQQVEPIGRIAGGDGVFTKELQRALLADEIDLAVHSLKDLPTEPVDGLRLGAVPQRGPNGDVLVCRGRKSLEQLPQGATLGTGSLRRRAKLWHTRPDLKMADIRGNVDTRIRSSKTANTTRWSWPRLAWSGWGWEVISARCCQSRSSSRPLDRGLRTRNPRE